MKKYFAFALVLLLTMALFGCGENAVLENSYVYEVESDIHSLEIKIGAADFTIQHTDTFSVESNLKYLSITEQDGVLSIIDKKTSGVTYNNPILTLYIPKDMEFKRINIATGAGALTADSLFAESIKLKLGAGDVSIANLIAESNADIEGGAGKISIAGSTINNLKLEVGVGELNLTSTLLGDNELSFGVGSAKLYLIGKDDDYRIDIEKGIGNITVDGKTVADLSTSDNGGNYVYIKGGVGTVDLVFQESLKK